MTNNTRPFFLNLLQIRLPVAGVMSFIHRVSGVLMVLAVPLLIWILERSLANPDGFAQTRVILHTPIGQIGLILSMWALMHHLLAGIRFLLIDVDLGVRKPAYRITAFFVLTMSPLIAYLLALQLLGQQLPGELIGNLLGQLP